MVSIIVPVYNSEKYIGRCIDSLRNQTLKDIEIILVDDGSKDSSAQICNSHVKVDERIKYVYKSNGGVSSARNLGLDIASGEYVMFVDSDDRLASDACLLLSKCIYEGKYDCVVCGIWQDSENLWTFDEEREYEINSLKKDFPRLLETELLSVCFNKIYRRDLIIKRFNNEMSFGEDLVFVLDYIENCNHIKIITAPLYLHNNINESSLCHNFNVRRLLDIETYQARIIRFYDGNDYDVNRKYIRDIICWLKFLFKSSLSDHEKIRILRQWKPNANICEMHFSDINVRNPDRLMLRCIKYGIPRVYLLVESVYKKLFKFIFEEV